ncbi:hypothetical protein SCLCIDRAFT_24151 [Scleroderma citrinum Foug A]|uniref:Uncharacterized protein n=1 Tax=Scleroderma citrinum Foug A TaxID=1036808 RepID=A0A0C3AET9_9AGAM|nr:hypothetical protein SCLCIDRAFT_24151 [Scleroderma citrinum Foug A]
MSKFTGSILQFMMNQSSWPRPLMDFNSQTQYSHKNFNANITRCTAINTVHIKHLDHIEMCADFTGIQGIGIQCEAVQDGDNHSSPTVDLIDNANSSLAEDSHGNDEAIDHEEDTLFTQILVDYIEEIYN